RAQTHNWQWPGRSGFWRRARSEEERDAENIVPDERRRDGPKAARRVAVALRNPPDGVACLRVASATRLPRAPCQRVPEGDPDRCQLWDWTLRGHHAPEATDFHMAQRPLSPHLTIW